MNQKPEKADTLCEKHIYDKLEKRFWLYVSSLRRWSLNGWNVSPKIFTICHTSFLWKLSLIYEKFVNCYPIKNTEKILAWPKGNLKINSEVESLDFEERLWPRTFQHLCILPKSPELGSPNERKKFIENEILISWWTNFERSAQCLAMHKKQSIQICQASFIIIACFCGQKFEREFTSLLHAYF